MRGVGSVGGIERQGNGTTAVGDRGRRGTPLASAHAAAVLRLGLEGRADGTDGRESPDSVGSSRRAAAIGGVTVAMLVAAGIGIPDSGRIAANGGTGRGSVQGSPGFTAVGSAMGTQGARRQEHDQMQTPGLRAALAAGVVMIASSAGAQQGAAVQWKVSDGGNGHWYQVVIDSPNRTWTEAREQSQSAGGDLCVLADPGEFGFVVSIARAMPEAWYSPNWWAVKLGPWVGATQDSSAPGYAEPAGGWRWIDGTPISSSDPNCWFNNATGCGVDENRMHLWDGFPSPGDIVLEDIPERGFCDIGPVVSHITEWSADCNNDGIVDYGQCRDGSLPDYNVNNIPDCCETQTPCSVGRYPVQWSTADGGNGHWYLGVRFGAAGASWTQAREDAIARGGDLVSLNKLVERQWVFDRVSRNPVLWTTTLGPWVGGLQPAGSPEPAGGWMWVDGTPVYEDFSWNDYHPDGNNNCGGPANRMTYWGNYTQGVGDLFADCADAVRFRCWNIDFGNHPSSVVEWSADCNNDGIVDYGQILQGQLADADSNGVPDVCKLPTCADADLNPNGTVDGADLGAMLAFWGPVSPAFPRADINGDGTVNGADLGILLSVWGPCGG